LQCNAPGVLAALLSAIVRTVIMNLIMNSIDAMNGVDGMRELVIASHVTASQASTLTLPTASEMYDSVGKHSYSLHHR
jgi:hypothetical protein